MPGQTTNDRTRPHPPVLIESWLPIAELSVESQRERAASSALPPLHFLHVWWARRPLTASRAAVLASLLPRWSKDWPAHLRRKFPTEEAYRAWFIRLLGIKGDPVAARRLVEAAAREGKRIPNPYHGPRAFTVNPEEADLQTMLDLLELTWGRRDLTVADPMAGGGSIPFEALRYGFTVFANELNPVASVILKATLDYPARFGPDLAREIRQWGQRWYEMVRPRLDPFFTALPPGSEGAAYLWARTVACPVTGKPVPLSPNWWLQRPKNAPVHKLVAVRLLCEPDWPECRFEIVRGQAALAAKPDEGTVKRGVGRSPWTKSSESISEAYIKAEAQAGRMGQQLYAVAVKRPGGFDFREPTDDDLAAVARAEAELARRLPQWEAKGLVPRDAVPIGNKTRELLNYGMPTWADMFSPRQLLALCTFAETLAEVRREMEAAMPRERAAAVATYLAFALDKAADYNSRRNRWDPTRLKIPSGFERHDFSFKWSFGEFDASRNLLPWALDQVVEAYEGIAKLVEPARGALFQRWGRPVVERLTVTRANAVSLAGVAPNSVTAVVVDPPYLDNVMYAELSDFFYVWMKRTLGDLYQGWFTDELANKDEEAVANVARFNFATEGKREKLAQEDYERKMAACFREMHRILAPEGVLTVMFTHKQVAAWDTLAMALINAGFTVLASWPVQTESEHSLHQAKKNAAASTILLVCRKHTNTGEPAWWDDLRGRVRAVAREKAAEFERQGVRGVDLYISTFGPVLSIISERWPVLTREVDERTGEPKPLRPDVALNLAREEVVALRKQGLLLGRAVQFDPVTDWYLMAWDTFKAQEFPADEARKLAVVLGLDLERDIIRGKRVVTKKEEFVAMRSPMDRRGRGMVDPEETDFRCLLDAVHTAMLAYQEDGAKACEVFLNRSGLRSNSTFRACLQAMINAIPRTKKGGRFLRIEAELLEALRLNFFDDLAVPPEEAPPKLAQLTVLATTESEEQEQEEEFDEEPAEEDEE